MSTQKNLILMGICCCSAYNSFQQCSFLTGHSGYGLQLYYKLSSIVTFTFTQIFDQNFVFFADWRQSCRVCLIQRQNSRYFRCPV